MTVHRKDASAFWAEIDLTPVADSDGWYGHLIAVVRDRSERRKAEQAQRESARTLRRLAERQRAMIDALPAHVALLDGEGRIVSVSRSWTESARMTTPAADPAGMSYYAFLEHN